MKFRNLIPKTDEGSFAVLALPIVVGAFLLAFLSVFQLLIPHYWIAYATNEDLKRHIALGLNFRDALLQGQIIPRLQPNPLSIPDIPVFQYYGFLSSLFTQPGLMFGLSPFHALISGVVIIRWLAEIGIYITCRILNLTRSASAIAVIAWISFPYIQSNFYGRIAIPETFAQAILVMLPLSWAIASYRSKRIAAIVVAVTVLLLALAHPIFLMWGVGALMVIIFMGFIFRKKEVSISLLIGLVLGVFISSFQWFPILTSFHDFATQFSGESPFYSAHLTSLSGLFGLPHALREDGAKYYFTVSSWIIPVIFCAFLRTATSKKDRNDILLFILLTLIFLFISYSPMNFWQFLPKFTWATQYPYRMLSFVGSFAVILLAYIFDSINSKRKIIPPVLMAATIVFLSGPSLLAPVTWQKNIFKPGIDVKDNFPDYDYLVIDKSELGKVVFLDGWLRKDNLVPIPALESDITLNFAGESGLPLGRGERVRIIDAKTRRSILDKDLFVSSTGEKISINIPHGVRSVSIVPSRYFKLSKIDPRSTDRRMLSLRLSSIFWAPRSTTVIWASDVKRIVLGGYKRAYIVMSKGLPPPSMYLVELPLAYSRFQEITQSGVMLQKRPSYNGLTLVSTSRIDLPIVASYNVPVLSVLSHIPQLLFDKGKKFCYSIFSRVGR